MSDRDSKRPGRVVIQRAVVKDGRVVEAHEKAFLAWCQLPFYP